MTTDLPAREAALYAELDRLGVAHRTVEHEATFTVADSAQVKAGLAGGHAKTLLVGDGARLFLLVALGSGRVDLKATRAALGARRLSLAAPAVLARTLGLSPGSVTPFGLLGAPDAGEVARVIVDEALLAADPIWLHPMRNTASTAVSPAGLARFCEARGFEVILLPLTGSRPEAR